MDTLANATQSTPILLGAAAVVGYIALRMLGGDYRVDASFGRLEKQLTRPISLAVVAVAASVVLPAIPERATSFLKSPAARLGVLFLLGAVASGDIESAVASVLLVLISVQLLRTKDERLRNPYIV